MNKPKAGFEVVHMKSWQSKILQAVAWAVGIRGEDVWVITMFGDDELYQKAKSKRFK